MAIGDALKTGLSNLQDALFTTHRSGSFYTYRDFIVFKSKDESTEVAIPYPCSISVSGGTASDDVHMQGTNEKVIQISEFMHYTVAISFEAGDYRIPLLYRPARGSVVKAHDVIRDLARFVRYQTGEVRILQGADVSVFAKAYEAWRGEESLLDPQTPLLEELGITHVMFNSISIAPSVNHRYQVSVSCTSVDSDNTGRLFMTEEEYEKMKGGGR